MRSLDLCKLGVVMLLILATGELRAQEAMDNGSAEKPGRRKGANLYLKMKLDKNLKVSALKPGDVVEGKLLRDVYEQYWQLFPAGSLVRLTVDQLERRRRVPNDHWPWVVNVFMPWHEKYPTFQSAKVILARKGEVPLHVSFVSMGHEAELHAKLRSKSKGNKAGEAETGDTDVVSLVKSGFKNISEVHSTAAEGFTATFEASVEDAGVLAKTPKEEPLSSPDRMVTIAAGTRAKVILLEGVSASKSREGDVVQARLVEPVFYNSTVLLPEGTVLEGKVVKRIPPRMLSRSGSLMLAFTAVNTAAGPRSSIEASVAGVELDRRSHATLDDEGGLHGDRPGLGWTMINLAATAGIAKMSDDGLQLVIELIVSSATDVSTAGTARIVAACVSGAFLLTRHGRDVVLPKFTEMEIVFDRAVTIPTDRATSATRQERGSAGSPHPEVSDIDR